MWLRRFSKLWWMLHSSIILSLIQRTRKHVTIKCIILAHPHTSLPCDHAVHLSTAVWKSCCSDRCQVNNTPFELGMPDRQHFSRSWFVCTCSGAVTLAVCGVFTLRRAEDVAKGEEVEAGRRWCRLNPGISNAVVANVTAQLLSQCSIRSILSVKLQFNRVFVMTSCAFHVN